MVINPIVGVYIPTRRIPIKGGMTIPNIATFDRGTYEYCFFCCWGTRDEPQLANQNQVVEDRHLEALQKVWEDFRREGGRNL